MGNVIKKLQAQPDEKKIRILWTAVIVAIMIILGIWFLTINFRERESRGTDKFDSLMKNLQELKNKFHEARP